MARYSVADWYGVVTPAGVALLPRTVPLGAVERVWQALKEGSGPGAVIEGLVGTFGAALRNLPDFALLSLAENGGVRIALRGAVAARLLLAGTAAEESLSGGGVSTWTEQLVTDVDRVELAVAGTGGECDLPISDGIVLAGRVVFWLNESEERKAAARPADGLAEPVGRAETAAELAVVAAEPVVVAAEPVVVAAEPAAAAEPEPAVVAVAEPELEPVWSDAVGAGVSTGSTGEFGVAVDADEPAAAVSTGSTSDGAGVSAGSTGRVGDAGEVGDAGGVGDVGDVVDAAPAARAAETMVAEEAPNDYDRLLYGETVLSSVEDAAIRLERADLGVSEAQLGTPPLPPPLPASVLIPPPPPPPPSDPAAMIAHVPAFAPVDGPPAAPEPESWQDHDGQTVLVEALFGGQQASAPVVPAAPAAAWQPPRLLVPGQAPVVLDRSAIVGVRPRFTRVQDGNVPLLVTVNSPKGEISRSHLELRLEGRTLLAVDLDSTNGTMLLRQGADPVRLHPGDPSILVPGDRIDLGDDVTLEFEGLA